MRPAFLPGVILKWQRDQVAKATIGQSILIWEKSVIGGHAELVPPGHGLRKQIAAHLPCG